MDGRLRKEGAAEAFDLGEISGIEALRGNEVRLIHRGAIEANIWARRTQAVQLAEARAIAEVIKTEDPEVLEIVYGPARDALEVQRLEVVEALEKEGRPVPARFDSPVMIRQVIRAPDEPFRELQRDAVASLLESAIGPAFEGVAADAVVHEIERLGCLLAVYKKAMEVQRLSAEEFPAAASVGGDGSEVDPVVGVGDGDAAPS